uniref:Uncharacterized protein n=1 Tax=Oryza sativa subsp. japonica TaxID=39947 RepID=Q651H4_ORYSJ|nr:hypothetical protein [Oryza sativa Japonica Group]
MTVAKSLWVSGRKYRGILEQRMHALPQYDGMVRPYPTRHRGANENQKPYSTRTHHTSADGRRTTHVVVVKCGFPCPCRPLRLRLRRSTWRFFDPWTGRPGPVCGHIRYPLPLRPTHRRERAWSPIIASPIWWWTRPDRSVILCNLHGDASSVDLRVKKDKNSKHRERAAAGGDPPTSSSSPPPPPLALPLAPSARRRRRPPPASLWPDLGVDGSRRCRTGKLRAAAGGDPPTSLPSPSPPPPAPSAHAAASPLRPRRRQRPPPARVPWKEGRGWKDKREYIATAAMVPAGRRSPTVHRLGPRQR